MEKNKTYIHLIPADFEEYNLEDLIAENKKNKEVCWSNGYANGKGSQTFNINDIVYIYFHDRKGITNRILLQAKVSRSDTDTTDGGEVNKDDHKYFYSEYCKNKGAEASLEEKEKATQNIKGFYLSNFNAISKEYEDNFKYISNKGIKGILKINQTKIYLAGKNETKNKSTILNFLESENMFNRNIKDLLAEYNTDVCKSCRNNKKTFKKQNGLDYYELHHVLQQSFNKLKVKPSWYNKNKYGEYYNNKLIYNKYNEVKLCSNCHNELHYGRNDRRREILDKIVDQKYKDELHKIVNNDSEEKEILKYVYNQYSLSYDEKA
jgi:hypothetical protein